MDENLAEIKQLKQDRSMSSGFINSIGSREVGDFFFRKLIICVTRHQLVIVFLPYPFFFFQSFLFKMNIGSCHRGKQVGLLKRKDVYWSIFITKPAIKRNNWEIFYRWAPSSQETEKKLFKISKRREPNQKQFWEFKSLSQIFKIWKNFIFELLCQIDPIVRKNGFD